MRTDVCKFYDGGLLRGDKTECEARINPIQDFAKGELAGWVKKVPCFKKNENAPECSKIEFPTIKEVKAYETEWRAKMLDVVAVIDLIPLKGGHGQVECPRCKGVVDWARATSNGHRHVKCRTENCMFFME